MWCPASTPFRPSLDRTRPAARKKTKQLESEVEDGARCLAEAAQARRTLLEQGWSTCPTWSALLDGARPARQWHLVRGLAARLAVPRIADPYRTLSRSRAPALLATQFPCIAPLPGRAACRPLAHRHTVRHGHQHPATSHAGCLEASLAPASACCPDVVEPWMLSATMPSLAREQACWPDEPKSSSVPGPAWREPKVRSCQQAVARPHDRGRHPSKRSPVYSRRLVYGATADGGALCCDATLVSPLTRTGHPHPCTIEVDGLHAP